MLDVLVDGVCVTVRLRQHVTLSHANLQDPTLSLPFQCLLFSPCFLCRAYIRLCYIIDLSTEEHTVRVTDTVRPKA